MSREVDEYCPCCLGSYDNIGNDPLLLMFWRHPYDPCLYIQGLISALRITVTIVLVSKDSKDRKNRKQGVVQSLWIHWVIIRYHDNSSY